MMPTMFVLVSRIPLISSSRHDRHKLCNLASQIKWTEAANECSPPRKPLNAIEYTTQQICVEILDTAPEKINLDVDFFNMGGDSIRVMQLVSRARHADLPITMRQVFVRLFSQTS